MKPSATQSMVRINRLSFEVPEPSDDTARRHDVRHTPRRGHPGGKVGQRFSLGASLGAHRPTFTPILVRSVSRPVAKAVRVGGCRRRRHPARWVRAHDTRGRARRGPVGGRRCIRPDRRASRGHRGRPGGACRRDRRRAGPCPLRSSHQQRREKGGHRGLRGGADRYGPSRTVVAAADGAPGTGYGIVRGFAGLTRGLIAAKRGAACRAWRAVRVCPACRWPPSGRRARR